MYKEFSITNKYKRSSSMKAQEVEYFMSFNNLNNIATIYIGYDDGAHQQIYLTEDQLDDLIAGLDSLRKSRE